MLITSGKPGQPQVWHAADLPIEERHRLHGRGTFAPRRPVVAGDHVTLTFQFEIGETSVPAGGRLRVAWRWPFDWADLQADDPEGDGYMTVSVLRADPGAPEVSMDPTFQWKGGLDPWLHDVELVVVRGRLRQGDRVRLICGDRSGGGRGWRAPTFRTRAAEFLMLINPDNSQRWIRLPDAPGFAIVPGPPARLVAVAPSDAVVGEPLDVRVRAEDAWGNPTPIGDETPRLHLPRAGGVADVLEPAEVSDDPAVYYFFVQFEEPATHRLVASVPGTDLAAESNPIRIHETRPPLRLFWGDLHSGQTDIGCGAGSLADHFLYAREAAALQFASQQANDHYITADVWQHVRETTRSFDQPGRFVAFLGCEWSPLTEDGGDRNVIYRRDEPRLYRSGRFFTESEPDPTPDLPTAPAFHAAMQGKEVLINMHVGGRPTNLDYHAPEIEPLAEIHSTHGTSEWFVMDALQRGYRIGITAGTDGVMGRPGACQPGNRVTRNVGNGLTAVYAESLDEGSLWAAFQARRCYATSGERMILWVDVDGRPMGADYRAEGPLLISIAAEGTAPLERIDLLRGTDLLQRWQIAPHHAADSGWIRLLWGGAQRRGTAQDQQVIWDGSMHLTGGSIQDVRPVGFQSAADAVQRLDSQTLAWQSATAGNEAGVVLRIDGDAETVCRVSTDPCTFTFHLGDVVQSAMVVDAGGLDRRLRVGPAPRTDGPRRVERVYCDPAPLEGTWPYWVRVVQIDQGRAWSSPVYVTR